MPLLGLYSTHHFTLILSLLDFSRLPLLDPYSTLTRPLLYLYSTLLYLLLYLFSILLSLIFYAYSTFTWVLRGSSAFDMPQVTGRCASATSAGRASTDPWP